MPYEGAAFTNIYSLNYAPLYEEPHKYHPSGMRSMHLTDGLSPIISLLNFPGLCSG